MAFELTIGLWVVDGEKYARYRAEIEPLLKACGGTFRYDFEIAQTLKSEASHGINRLFVLQFPDPAAKLRFFEDPQYLEIRARLYEPSVQGWTTIAEHSS